MIGIITDSTCDIPPDLVEKYGIIIVPHTIIWGEEQYRDWVDMKPDEFYQRLVVDPELPTTSHAGMLDFKAAYEAAESRGATEIITLTVSSAMSGAYQMAVEAAGQVKVPVSVVDGKGPTMSLGWQVLRAARLRESGAAMGEILDEVAVVRSRLVQLVLMDTMKYLQHGGRIGEAVKWVGGLLQVKPLVSINHQTGVVQPVSLARTRNSGIEMLYTRFFSLLPSTENLHIAVMHGNAMEKAEELSQRIREQYHPLEMIVNTTGPVLGINTGPGALALCGYPEG